MVLTLRTNDGFKISKRYDFSNLEDDQVMPILKELDMQVREVIMNEAWAKSKQK